MFLHHVGYVVDDIEAAVKSMPGLTRVKTVEDDIQNARLCLYRLGGDTQVEFIQPLSDAAFTWSWLEQNGAGLHHVCYDGIDARKLDSVLREHRLLKVRGPMPAVLFDRDVVFAMTRQRTILEFVL